MKKHETTKKRVFLQSNVFCKQLKMEKEIPKISFKENQSLDIEVMNFPQLFDKLNQS